MESLALDEPPIMGDYSAPVLVRIAAKEYFTAKFFRYENGIAMWEICYDDKGMLTADAGDYWMPIDGFEEDFE